MFEKNIWKKIYIYFETKFWKQNISKKSVDKKNISKKSLTEKMLWKKVMTKKYFEKKLWQKKINQCDTIFAALLDRNREKNGVMKKSAHPH